MDSRVAAVSVDPLFINSEFKEFLRVGSDDQAPSDRDAEA